MPSIYPNLNSSYITGNKRIFTLCMFSAYPYIWNIILASPDDDQLKVETCGPNGMRLCNNDNGTFCLAAVKISLWLHFAYSQASCIIQYCKYCHLLSRWWLVRFIRPCRWRQYIPPKRQVTFNGLYGVTSQKISFFRFQKALVNKRSSWKWRQLRTEWPLMADEPAGRNNVICNRLLQRNMAALCYQYFRQHR
jgi:hypothetical protein